jgi:hypothetical protein
MDGVLTDFNRKYKELYGVDPAVIKAPEFDSRWKGFITGGHFLNLEWNDGGITLVNYINASKIPYEILSSTGGKDYFELIRDQKKVWLKEHGIGCPVNIVAGRKFKTEYAAPDVLLIDDQSKIVERFVEAGGNAIHHTDILSTIFELKHIHGITL